MIPHLLSFVLLIMKQREVDSIFYLWQRLSLLVQRALIVVEAVRINVLIGLDCYHHCRFGVQFGVLQRLDGLKALACPWVGTVVLGAAAGLSDRVVACACRCFVL